MYVDESSNEDYPKTLIVRNHYGGMIWQVYHVQKEREAKILSTTAATNGFEAVTLIDYDVEMKETWPDWRVMGRGPEICNE